MIAGIYSIYKAIIQTIRYDRVINALKIIPIGIETYVGQYNNFLKTFALMF